MTPAEIAEDLRHLADDVGMTDAETADKLRALLPHIRVLGTKARPELPDELDEIDGTDHDHDLELTLLGYIVDQTQHAGAFDRAAIRRMAAWLTDRFGEPDA